MFPPKTRILILDDMLIMRKIVKNTLKTIGFEDIQEAVDGKEGWTLLEGSASPIQLSVVTAFQQKTTKDLRTFNHERQCQKRFIANH